MPSVRGEDLGSLGMRALSLTAALCMAMLFSCIVSLADLALRPMTSVHTQLVGTSPPNGLVSSSAISELEVRGLLHSTTWEWSQAATIWSTTETRWYVPVLRRPIMVQFVSVRVSTGWPLPWAHGRIDQFLSMSWEARYRHITVASPIRSTALWHDSVSGLEAEDVRRIFVPGQIGASGAIAAVLNGIVWLLVYSGARRAFIWTWRMLAVVFRRSGCSSCGYDVRKLSVCPECGRTNTGDSARLESE